MRYYWGLAAGHTYTHSMKSSNSPTRASATSKSADEPNELDEPEPETLASSGDTGLLHELPEQDNDSQRGDDPELGFENRQDDFLDEVEAEDEGGMEDDDEFCAMVDMYGFGYD